jgi:fatty-acyl-CoA synthase
MSDYTNVGYDYQLTIDRLLERALKWNPGQKIVYRDTFEYTYADLGRRIRKLASLLEGLGVKQGDAIGVMDWDSHRYLEAYFAVPMMGTVLHTVNVRLSAEQILYTLNHAEDRVLIIHQDFLPILDKIHLNLETVRKVIVIGEGETPAPRPWISGDYETMLETASDRFEFPALDERTVATTFYTTGTTGNPKGVFFTHRQIVLHTLNGVATLSGFSDPISFRSDDVYMPITPMFHVHAWGMPFMATMMGTKQVYPGRYEPQMLLQLLVKHGVTFSHCVPTILQMILSSAAAADVDFSRWKVIIGGSALPRGLAKAAMARRIGIATGYGMSETCPILTIAHLKDHMKDWSVDRRTDVILKTGFQVPLVDIRVVDRDGAELPPGKANVGELVVRAPWLTGGYFKVAEKSKELWRGGWLHTGDVAYRDEEGYVVITDRLKDVIKTGGEWVSSLDLESLISQHEAVAEVAVVGVPDEKWGERPAAYVVERETSRGKLTADALKTFLQTFVDAGHIERWAIPDQVVVVDALPKTSVGKLDKKALRGEVPT